MSSVHPLSWIGVLVAIIGWAFLLFGSGIDVDAYEFGVRSVFNLHKAAIAQNVIFLGYAMAISGVIAGVGKRLVLSHEAKIEPDDILPIERSNTDTGLSAPSSERAALLRASLHQGKERLT